VTVEHGRSIFCVWRVISRHLFEGDWGRGNRVGIGEDGLSIGLALKVHPSARANVFPPVRLLVDESVAFRPCDLHSVQQDFVGTTHVRFLIHEVRQLFRGQRKS